MGELDSILEKFVSCGWGLISTPSKLWINEGNNKTELVAAIEGADKICGSCGC